jgi:P pilus assembly chaperone PapD
VPPKNKGGDQVMNVAYQTRIKLFLRPEGLDGNINLAARKIKWIRNEDSLTAHNPTPYYFSFAGVKVGAQYSLASFEGKMIAPFSTLSSSEDISVLSKVQEVHYSIIDDMGKVIGNSFSL